MLRELSKIVQMALQVIIDAFDIYLCVDMDEKRTVRPNVELNRRLR